MSTPELVDFFPGIISSHSTQVYDVLSPLGKSVPSLITKHLLIHSYSPKIAVMSSPQVDEMCKNVVVEKHNKQDVNCFLDLLNYFEQALSELDSGKVSLNGSPSRLVVQFTKPIHEQLGSQTDNKADVVAELYNMENYKSVLNDYIKQIDSYTRLKSNTGDTDKLTIDMDNGDIRLLNNSIYSKLLLLSLSSNLVSPLEYFNHPIIQLFAISANDGFEEIKKSLIDWRDKQAYPNWIDISEILPMFLIVINSEKEDELQAGLRLQEDIKIRLGIKCSIVALNFEPLTDETSTKTLYPSNFLSVDNFLQNDLQSIVVPEKIFDSLLNTLNDLIYKDMVPYMERKIKVWNEEVVAPRKSFTGRLFNRKWGSASASSLPIANEKPKGSSFFFFGGSHNSSGETADPRESVMSEPSTPPSIIESNTFYDATSPEMLIRRKADWSFMLRDYKSSYTTYELIKKDFINSKSYLYLASVQEFMIMSLLVGSSNKVNPLNPDIMRSTANVGGITMKIITDVINPFVESSYYTYLSRCNLKTYTIRLLLTVAELYVCLGQSTSTLLRHNIAESSNSVGSEIYLIEALKLFKKLISSRLLDSNSNGKIMERIGYIYDNFGTHITDVKGEIDTKDDADEEEQVNFNKVSRSNLDTIGMKRSRQSILWLLLASKEIDPISKPIQVRYLINTIEKDVFDSPNYASPDDSQWLSRDQTLISRLKNSVFNSL